MFTCEVKTVDVGEVNVSRTFGRTAVVQKFPDFVAAFSHLLKPFARNGSQFAGMCFHSAIDGGIALDGGTSFFATRPLRLSSGVTPLIIR